MVSSPASPSGFSVVERLRLAPPIEPDQVVGDAEDVLGASIVAFEPDDPAAGIVVLEFEDVAQVRAPPAVNRLVGVARDAEVRDASTERAPEMAYWARLVSWYSSTRT